MSRGHGREGGCLFVGIREPEVDTAKASDDAGVFTAEALSDGAASDADVHPVLFGFRFLLTKRKVTEWKGLVKEGNICRLASHLFC